MGLFIAMETLKSLPLAEVRQNHQPQDRSTIYRIGSVNLTIYVQILQHVFPIRYFWLNNNCCNILKL